MLSQDIPRSEKILKTATTSDIYSWQTVTFFNTYIDISGAKISNQRIVWIRNMCQHA